MNNDDIKRLEDKIDNLNHKVDSMQSDINTIKGFSKICTFCNLLSYRLENI